MYKSAFRYFSLFIFLVTLNKVNAQLEPYPFWNEIQQFKQQDSIQFPPAHAILFVGSSSFRFWKEVQQDFPGYTIINRGFGGSTLPDVIRYANDIIFPYHPKEIVIYCGENDLAEDDSITPQIVFDRFKTLFKMIRKEYKKIPIVFVSIKPSPSRERLMPEMLVANLMIKKFLAKKRKSYFVDIYHKMLTPDGKPMPDIFVSDNLHMNRKGYAIWQQAIQPYLVKN